MLARQNGNLCFSFVVVVVVVVFNVVTFFIFIFYVYILFPLKIPGSTIRK